MRTTLFVLLALFAASAAVPASAGPDLPPDVPLSCMWHSDMNTLAPGILGFRDGTVCTVVLFPCDDTSHRSCLPE